MRKKLIVFSICLIIIIGVLIILFKSNFIQVEVSNNENIENMKNMNNTEKVTPEEEISDKQLRTSSVKLYFCDKEEKLEEESREIDVKELMKDPYKIIINMLIEGPKNVENEKLIPDGTKLNGVERIGEVLTIDFSKEFIDNCSKDINKQELLLKSIVYSIMELREIEAIKILIEGKEVKSFNNNGYDLSGEISFE